MDDRRPRVRLEPNRPKLLEAILFLIEEGERDRSPLTQYQIVKSLFLADVAHLNQFGRPITFDNYAALEFGPVPSEAYEMLKPTYRWRLHFPLDRAPWEREPASLTSKAYRYVRPARSPNLRVLSRSDLQHLAAALERVRELGFGGTRDETHQHPAYVDAWSRRGDRLSVAMDYGQLLGEDDPDTLADIAFASRHQGHEAG